jgi:hypothetical protein
VRREALSFRMGMTMYLNCRHSSLRRNVEAVCNVKRTAFMKASRNAAQIAMTRPGRGWSGCVVIKAPVRKEYAAHGPGRGADLASWRGQ